MAPFTTEQEPKAGALYDATLCDGPDQIRDLELMAYPPSGEPRKVRLPSGVRFIGRWAWLAVVAIEVISNAPAAVHWLIGLF